MIFLKKIRQKRLAKKNLSEVKKNHPEHKHSVTFITKVGIIIRFIHLLVFR